MIQKDDKKISFLSVNTAASGNWKRKPLPQMMLFIRQRK